MDCEYFQIVREHFAASYQNVTAPSIKRIHKTVDWEGAMLFQPAGSTQFVAYFNPQKEIRGYFKFSFAYDQFFRYDMTVKDFVYLDSDAMFALLGYISSQADQIRHVIW